MQQLLQPQPQSKPVQLITLHFNYHYKNYNNYNYISATSTAATSTALSCLQPLVRPSMGSLCHPSFTGTNLSYIFPIATALCGTYWYVVNIYICMCYLYI